MKGQGGQGEEERRVEGISVFFGPTELPVCYLAPLPLACLRGEHRSPRPQAGTLGPCLCLLQPLSTGSALFCPEARP